VGAGNRVGAEASSLEPMKTFSKWAMLAAAAVVWATHVGFAATTVDVAAKPGGTWKKQPTRTLEDLPAAVQTKTDGALTVYGGRSDRRGKSDGVLSCRADR
jgi:hypothetical protein